MEHVIDILQTLIIAITLFHIARQAGASVKNNITSQMSNSISALFPFSRMMIERPHLAQYFYDGEPCDEQSEHYSEARQAALYLLDIIDYYYTMDVIIPRASIFDRLMNLLNGSAGRIYANEECSNKDIHLQDNKTSDGKILFFRLHKTSNLTFGFDSSKNIIEHYKEHQRTWDDYFDFLLCHSDIFRKEFKLRQHWYDRRMQAAAHTILTERGLL